MIHILFNSKYISDRIFQCAGAARSRVILLKPQPVPELQGDATLEVPPCVALAMGRNFDAAPVAPASVHNPFNLHFKPVLRSRIILMWLRLLLKILMRPRLLPYSKAKNFKTN
jgi:hypothetical protein